MEELSQAELKRELEIANMTNYVLNKENEILRDSLLKLSDNDEFLKISKSGSYKLVLNTSKIIRKIIRFPRKFLGKIKRRLLKNR